jgi:hypothetical protein
VSWIRIRIRIGSGSRRAKMTQNNRTQLLNFIYRSAGCSLFTESGSEIEKVSVESESRFGSRSRFSIKKLENFTVEMKTN